MNRCKRGEGPTDKEKEEAEQKAGRAKEDESGREKQKRIQRKKKNIGEGICWIKERSEEKLEGKWETKKKKENWNCINKRLKKKRTILESIGQKEKL